MRAGASIDTAGGHARGWGSRALALTFIAACSSSAAPAGTDAAASDASADDAAVAIDVDEGDASPDVALAHDGTVRGGAGGGRIDGAGAGGAGGDDAAGGAEVAGPAPANDTCAGAQPIAFDHPRFDLAVSTRGANHDLDLGCGAAGGDVFFSFTLAERELVYADSFGATLNTVLAFADGCGVDAGVATPPICNDDACGATQSQVVALLAPGPHMLVVSGAAGDVTIHLEHALVGTGAVSALGPGSSTASGMTSGTGRLSLCEAGGPENSYWWTTCSGFAGGRFTASTCAGTVYDSILALQIPRTAAVVCDDDTCRLQASIDTTLPSGAGLHVLTVDGFTGRQQGAYALTTVRP
jgi:hypothetical protein